MAPARKKTGTKVKPVQYLLPLYGPLLIPSIERYLIESKDLFFYKFEQKTPTVRTRKFIILCTIGRGAFGSVKLVQDKKKHDFFAMKAISKHSLVKKKRIDAALTEKRLLQSLDCPFTIRLEYFCQDPSYIYFVMPFISGGDMFTHLHRLKKFKEDISCFYAAQLVLALEYLQYLHLVHRDLKPENILIDHLGFLKLTDFGLAKKVEGRTYTICGTPPYIAPEVIQGRGYARSADWWSLGILIYEMNTGNLPFQAHGVTNLYLRIMYDTFRMPRSFSKGLKIILRKLLQKDVTRRIGNMQQGADEVKNEKWFQGINWLNLLNRTIKPPFVPKCTHPGDTSNFAGLHETSTMVICSIDEFVDEFKDF